MKNTYRTALVAMLLAGAFTTTAHAQFGNLLLGDKSQRAGDGHESGNPEKLVARYVQGSLNVLRADAALLGALGLKDEAERANALATSLTADPTTSNMEQASKMQSEHSQAIEARLQAKQADMSDASKRLFAEGTQLLAIGIIQYVGVGRAVAGYTPRLDAGLGAARSMVFIAKDLPVSAPALGRTLKAVTAFSKANKIPVPKDADAATAML